MSENDTTVVSVEFDRADYERLRAVSEAPAELVHDAALGRIDLE